MHNGEYNLVVSRDFIDLSVRTCTINYQGAGIYAIKHDARSTEADDVLAFTATLISPEPAGLSSAPDDEREETETYTQHMHCETVQLYDDEGLRDITRRISDAITNALTREELNADQQEPTYWQEILHHVLTHNGEYANEIVIGYNSDAPLLPYDAIGKVLTPEQAEPLLSYKYDNNYGSAHCHPVWVQVMNNNNPVAVIVSKEYDGLTSLLRIPVWSLLVPVTGPRFL